MRPSMGFVIKSALFTAVLKVRGVSSSLAACEGRLPGMYTKGKVSTGKRFIVRSRILRCEFGAALPTARLRLGDRVFINQGASIVAYSSIEIGDYALIGEYVTVSDTNQHSSDTSGPARHDPVVIGDNVWLCRGVKVMPGSKIGDHTVVSAGSVVRGELPSRVLAAGDPAKPIKELDTPNGWYRV